ncbi:MAG: hypothetical protein E7370_03125 [Clostridiales bacterium]|nr:hypothetical protein [Clostridiales bacterium]
MESKTLNSKADNRISVRQICFILIAFNVCGKVLLYPTNLSFYTNNDLWIAALIDFLIHGVAVWAAAYACSKSDLTLYTRLQNAFGKIPAKIIMGLFALYFLFASILPLGEHKLYVQDIFYDTIPSLIPFLPFFIFSVYAGAKGLNSAARAADLCFILFIISVGTIIVMSFDEVDFSNLLPVFSNSPQTVLQGALTGATRFSEAAYILLFMGHFKYKKGDALKITVSYGVGGLIVLLVCVIFYGIYADLSSNIFFVISKISTFFSAVNNVGRVDYIALYALEIVMLFSLVLKVQACRYCVEKAIGFSNGAIISVAINAVLIILTVVFDHRFTVLQNFVGGWGVIAFIIFANAIPISSLLLKKGEGKNAKA